MENVVIEGNYGPAWGGGCYTHLDAVITGHDVLFLNNVGGNGGGLYAIASVTLEDASFIGNTGAWGGGLYAKYDDVTVTITRGLFAGNVGSQGGGILCCGHANLSLTECTLTGNVSTFYWGAGMHFQGAGDVVIANTIVAFNGQGGGIYNFGQPIELSCCDAYGNEDGDYLGYIEDPTGTAGNISVDPLFCGDLAPEAPYSLRADSDCAPGGTSCGQIGAFGVGCTVTAASPRTWTCVKSLY
ncbi:MAG: hypothetical protein JW819_14280 [Candidatus Krumholzibacteriota bacterium]|nr:hypothetical protein [Candidatus Krumholzibacteriota bacterium]